MNINSDMALIPVSHEVRPAKRVSDRGLAEYSDPNEKLVRISFSKPRPNNIGNIYDRFGAEKTGENAVGGNVDMYV